MSEGRREEGGSEGRREGEWRGKKVRGREKGRMKETAPLTKMSEFVLPHP